MLCKVCGREILNSQANFCEYCGTSTREDVFQYQVNKESNENKNYTYHIAAKEAQKSNNGSIGSANSTPIAGLFQKLADENSPVTFGQWMTFFLIVFVPMIGPFLYIGMLFVFSFSSKIKKSIKSWARATLIMFLVSFLILTPMLPELMSMLNGMI